MRGNPSKQLQLKIVAVISKYPILRRHHRVRFQVKITVKDALATQGRFSWCAAVVLSKV
jgi:hypothetical protein